MPTATQPGRGRAHRDWRLSLLIPSVSTCRGLVPTGTEGTQCPPLELAKNGWTPSQPQSLTPCLPVLSWTLLRAWACCAHLAVPSLMEEAAPPAPPHRTSPRQSDSRLAATEPGQQAVCGGTGRASGGGDTVNYKLTGGGIGSEWGSLRGPSEQGGGCEAAPSWPPGVGRCPG